jgi:hypothetical protein
MPKKTPNIMRVSGWLPVSYSVYKAFEKKIEKDCYVFALYVADALNDKPKMTNEQFLKSFAKHLMLDDKKLIEDEDEYISNLNSLIDFIRDSLIIYQDTISQEQKWQFELKQQ